LSHATCPARGAPRQSPHRQAVERIKAIGAAIDHVSRIANAVAVEEPGAATRAIARKLQQAAEATQNVTATIGDVRAAAPRCSVPSARSPTV